MSLTEDSLILYSDGGCLQNLNIGGWGLHGYYYIDEVPKQGSGCAKAILTNIGYHSKENKEQSGSPVTVLKYIDSFGSIVKNATNNIAELTAMQEALNFILNRKPKKVIIYTDSKYVVNGLNEWCANWIKTNWIKPDGSVVLNKEYWEELYSLKNKLLELKIDLTIEWVKGHSNNVGNDEADRLATYGLILAKKKLEHREIKELEPKGYWSKSFEYNRIIDKSRWYFNTKHPMVYNEGMVRKPDGRWVYHLGNHGPDDELFCKPISDSSFSVVYLTDPIKEMQLVRKYQNEITNNNFDNIVIGRLDRILSAEGLELLNTFDTLLIEKTEYQNNLTLNKSLITLEMNPQLLAYKATDFINSIEWVLDGFIDNPNKYGLVVTEITDIFYGIETKGKKDVLKLKSSISSNSKKINVKCNYDVNVKSGEITIPFVIGIDTPSRNSLSALTEENPKVFVVTWKESDEAIRYGTILKTDKDIGIWVGAYSNIRLLTP